MVRQVMILCAVFAGVSVEATVEVETSDGSEKRDAWAELERDAAAIDTTGEALS